MFQAGVEDVGYGIILTLYLPDGKVRLVVDKDAAFKIGPDAPGTK
jgi:hypothetical protein